jgi:GT2 family glycosyltransferase
VSKALPLVSVIVVCWNSADVLGRCLDQLQAQDYGNYEIIVVDDGSQDDTLEVAGRALSNGELTILRSPRNRGCPHARNLGLGHAKGEIIAFIDADGFAAPSWLRQIVAAFDSDATVGGVASTVFFAQNPIVINGAGGIVNRQGWAADLALNESYEAAEIGGEALYPMGCGMALRRSAIDRLGPFDELMLNYYDDVDYGIRLWRRGYRVVVAADAWVDHSFGGSDSSWKRLLCERHRMRVVLKQTQARTLTRWAARELGETARASRARRSIKLKAMAWNVGHLPSALFSRWRMRRDPPVPERLVDPSWGEGFPAGVPLRTIPRPETAVSAVDLANPSSEAQLLYGWFPAENAGGRSYRWAGKRAAALVRLETPARRLRLEYTHVPVDGGGVELYVRQPGSPEPLTPVWATHLSWQYTARSVENHPVALASGDYEVVFSARQGWSDPPRETRSLGFALSRMSFEDGDQIPPGGLDMASPDAETQLVSGWFEPERSRAHIYRWATGHAVALVRLARSANEVRVSYCLPPASIGELTISACPLGGDEEVWSTPIAWHDCDWHEDCFPVQLPAGDYLVSFDAQRTWSNPGPGDPAVHENRSLGFALSSLSFEGA